MKTSAFAIIAALAITASANAQIYSYDSVGFNYIQNFDGLIQTGGGSLGGVGPHDLTNSNLLASGTMAGWSFSNYGGSGSVTEFRAQNGSLGSSAGRGVISFGQTGDSDRALGTLATSNQISRFGFILQNNTGTVLTSFSLSFDGEMWRSGGVGLTNHLTFAYAVTSSAAGINASGFTDVSSLAYAATSFAPNEAAVNGNENHAFLGDTVSGFVWVPGDYLILRWSGEDLSGQDNGLAIDNMSFDAVPEPTAWAMLGVASAAVVFLRRRRN